MTSSGRDVSPDKLRMILKDLRFALRNLGRNKLLATINVLGLTTGITACLVIFVIAYYELSFERFQPEGERIFRVYSTFSGVFSGTNRGVATGIPVAMRDHFTGIENVTNFHSFGGRIQVPTGGGEVRDLGRYYKVIIADPDYFKVFNYYDWLAGTPERSLSEPFQVVISESRVKAYFGDLKPVDAIGREIRYKDSLHVTVSGVVKDITERTDLVFTDFISFSTIEKSWLKDNFVLNGWNGTNRCGRC
jgi:putative ABC transport system permease protein